MCGPDRIIVAWPCDVWVELPVAWCVSATLGPDQGGAAKLAMWFLPKSRSTLPTEQGGVELVVVVPTTAVPVAQTIVATLTERLPRGAARPAGGSRSAAEDSSGVVRNGDWVSFRPNPDTEFMLAGDEAESKHRS